MRRLFDETEGLYSRIAVLIKAATDDKTFDGLVSVNLKGSFNTMREAAARLRTGGRIVNISSSVIDLSLPGYAVYAATKAAAIETMTNIPHAATNAGQPASTLRPMSCEMTRNTPPTKCRREGPIRARMANSVAG